MAKYQPLAQSEDDLEVDSMFIDNQPSTSTTASSLSFDHHQVGFDIRQQSTRGKMKQQLLGTNVYPKVPSLQWMPSTNARNYRKPNSSLLATRYGLLEGCEKEQASIDTLDTGFSGSGPVQWPSLNADQNSSDSDSHKNVSDLY